MTLTRYDKIMPLRERDNYIPELIDKMSDKRKQEEKKEPAWAKVSQILGVLPSSLAAPSTYCS